MFKMGHLNRHCWAAAEAAFLAAMDRLGGRREWVRVLSFSSILLGVCGDPTIHTQYSNTEERRTDAPEN
jgi:hypothetical protein